MADKLTEFVNQLNPDQANTFVELLTEWDEQLDDTAEAEGFVMHRPPGAGPTGAFSDPVTAVPGLMDTIKGWFSKARDMAADVAEKAG